MSNKIHEGHNIKRFRELLGMKQEALAASLGDDWTQKKISMLETKETIEPELLEKVAEILEVPTIFLSDYDKETSTIHISNIHDNTIPGDGIMNMGDGEAYNSNNQYTFNVIDKLLELHERLLASEKEKTAILKAALDKLK